MTKLFKKIFSTIFALSVCAASSTALFSCSSNNTINPVVKSPEQLEYEKVVNQIANSFDTDQSTSANLMINNNQAFWSQGVWLINQLDVRVYNYLYDNKTTNPEFAKYFDLSKQYNHYEDLDSFVKKTVNITTTTGAIMPHVTNNQLNPSDNNIRHFNSDGLILNLIPNVQNITTTPVMNFHFFYNFNLRAQDARQPAVFDQIVYTIQTETAKNPLVVTGTSHADNIASLAGAFTNLINNQIFEGNFYIMMMIIYGTGPDNFRNFDFTVNVVNNKHVNIIFRILKSFVYWIPDDWSVTIPEVTVTYS